MTDKLAARLLEIKDHHEPREYSEGTMCYLCPVLWPCDAARLFDALQVAIQRLENIRDYSGLIAEPEEALALIDEKLG